ncbi:hypothetical protein K502DRAFT_369043 [Neoconidiobolus thromboides FSU 785]|nr:hypothetical protein K502DRAFT_369043 [Neoconidiobolus thromboides FSU 785]
MSKISLTSASVVVLTMIVISIIDYKLVDRVTLRLQTAISSYDIWLHCIPFWSRQFNYEGSPLCTFIGYQGVAFPLFYCFLNVAIGINLQLVFIHGVKTTKKIEAAYWIGSILLTLIITIPPLAMGLFGYNKFNRCYIAMEDEKYTRMLHFYTNVLVMIFCMIYLLIIVILVGFRLYRGVNLMSEQREMMDDNRPKKSIKNIKLFASRIVLYPIIMIFSHSGLVLTKAIYDLTGFASLEADAFGYITIGLLGSLNCTAFFLDPTVHHALKVIYNRIIKNQEITIKQPNEIDCNNEFELTTFTNVVSENAKNEAERPISFHFSNFIKSL